MSFFNRTTPETQDQLIKRTLSAITLRNDALVARKDAVLSQFRRTADELKFVNEGLMETAQVSDEMIAFFSTYKNDTEKAIADNAAVRDRILAIIGE